MSGYIPQTPFNVPLILYTPTMNIVKGVAVKEYPTNGVMIFGSFRTFGGTESESNGVLTVIDTATIETWYRPDIKAGCRLCLAEQPEKVYEILGTPENISMRNQFMKFKVQSVNGGA